MTWTARHLRPGRAADRRAGRTRRARRAGRPDDRRRSRQWPTGSPVIASTHHPFYYKASTARRGRGAALRGGVGPQGRGVPGDAHPGRARRPGDGRVATISTSCGSTTCRSSSWPCRPVRRQLGQRGARIRPARMHMRGDRDLSGHVLRGGLDAGFDLAFSNELRHRPLRDLPDHHARPQNELPDRADLHEYLRAAAAAAEAVRPAGQTAARAVESWPSDKRVAIIGTGHLSLELGGPRQFGPHGPDPEFDCQGRRMDRQRRPRGLPGRGDPGQPARAGQRHSRVHGLHAHDGRRGENAKATTSTPTTCSTRWRRTSPGTRTERPA